MSHCDFIGVTTGAIGVGVGAGAGAGVGANVGLSSPPVKLTPAFVALLPYALDMAGARACAVTLRCAGLGVGAAGFGLGAAVTREDGAVLPRGLSPAPRGLSPARAAGGRSCAALTRHPSERRPYTANQFSRKVSLWPMARGSSRAMRISVSATGSWTLRTITGSMGEPGSPVNILVCLNAGPPTATTARGYARASRSLRTRSGFSSCSASRRRLIWYW